MADKLLFPAAGGARAARAVLEATTEALSPGGVSFEAFLTGVSGALFASRILWVERDAHGFQVFGDRRRREGIDGRLFEDLRPGRLLRLEGDGLRCSARTTARGVGALTVCPELREHPGGRRRFLWIESTTALPIADADLEAFAAAAGRLRDLDLRLASSEDDEVLKRRGVSALALAHDLRHQISLALLLSQRAREDDPVAGLDELDRALAKARAVCEDAMADPRRGDQAATLRLVDLLEDEARTAGRIARNAGGVGIALRCPRTLRVRATASILSRLVRNLLLNAVHASNAGGRVRISAALDEGRVVVEVRDEGCGMDEEQVRSLFTTDRSGDGASGGAGCGTLSILACVEHLGATIEIESAPGDGTRVRLGLVSADSRALESGVLLVDPDRQRRARRAGELESRDLVVHAVSTAEEALAELERGTPSRVLLARGTPGAAVARLAQRAREESVELRVLAAGEDPAG